jgi:tRNA U34 5-methylaminomethyl-2-thiouridine-forming methyltransferase MnmC
MQYQIKTTGDGSHTIYLPDIDEQYHSLNGAITESDYVYIKKGYLYNNIANPTVFEAGFGTGLNCLLTSLAAEKYKRPTSYITLEQFPLSGEIINKLNYGKLLSSRASELFKTIHGCKWEMFVKISPFFQLYKMLADITKCDWQIKQGCDIIYYDAFAPGKQSEMWIPEIFICLFDITTEGGVFVTYSAKGVVRRRLAAAGYIMERLPGPPKKKEMLRGIKVSSNI